MSITIKKEKITPAKARKWLSSANEGNRKLKRGLVAAYSRDILADQWSFTGDPIRFNGDGKLVDGQHRLSAIVEANTPIEAMVIRGLQEDAKFCIDLGAKRTLGDILHYQGYKHTTSLAASVRWLIMYEREMLGGAWHSGQRVLSTQECLSWLEKNKRLVNSVQVVGNTRFPYTATRSALIAIRHLCGKNAAELDVFMGQLVEGEGLHKGHPAHTLRRYLEWAYLREGRFRTARIVQACVVKSWNAWIMGEQLASVNYKPGGAKAESFPQIILPGT